jgi:hypothetical protein
MAAFHALDEFNGGGVHRRKAKKQELWDRAASPPIARIRLP